MNRTYHRIRQYVTWEGMKNDIENYIRRCAKCQQNKLTQRNTKIPLTLTTTPTGVMEKCNIDVVGPLNVSQNSNRCILTIQDELSKFLVAVPLKQQTAEEVARTFVENVVLVFGEPQQLLSDLGSNFLSETFRNMCKLLRIHKLQTTPFHPMGNASNERSHRGMTEYIRCFVNKELSDWDEWVRYATFVHNTTPYGSTNFTPFELMFGRIAYFPGYLQKEPSSAFYAYESYLQELKARLQSSYTLARNKLESSKLKSKEYYDKTVHTPPFKVHDLVLMKDFSVRRGRSRKLESAYTGTYKIKRTEGTNVVLEGKRSKEIKVHTNLLKPFYV